MLGLAEGHKLSDSIEKLLLVVLASEENPLIDDAELIISKINNDFSFRIQKEQLKDARNELIKKNFIHVQGGNLILDSNKKSEYQIIIRNAKQLDFLAKEDWMATLAKNDEFQPAWKDNLWKFFRSYMGNVLKKYGIQTHQLLSSETHNNDENGIGKTLEVIFKEAYDEFVSDIPINFVSKALELYFSEITSNQLKITTEMLNGALTYFALVTDDILPNYLQKTMKPVLVFMDTNFIFGVVDLHSTPLNEISREIVNLVRNNKLPFRFIVHPRTIEEYNFALEENGKKLKEGEPWQPALSLAALSNGRHLTGIEKKYHQLNSESHIEVEGFLNRYREPEKLLPEFGFEIYKPDTPFTQEDKLEINKLINNFNIHIETRYGKKRSKTNFSLEHDITLLYTARKNRKPGGRVFEAESMCLTTDSTLYSFDWHDEYSDNNKGVTIFPNQLLNVLIPFMSMTDNFKANFLETFALPEFRSIETDYSQVTHRILVYLNTYKEFPTEAATRIITNSYLLQRLTETPIEANDLFEDIIDAAIAKDNVKLQTEIETLKLQLDTTNQQFEEIKNAYINYQNYVKTRDNLTIRVIAASLNISVFVFCTIFLPKQVNWTWFINHPNKLGLQFSLIAISACISWAIIEKNTNRRRIVLVSIVIPFIIGLAKLLGN